MTSTSRHHPALARLARPSGAFAMVAMDQRESLRAMFTERLGGPIEVERRIAFKLAVARILSPHASALLIDRPEGLQPVLEPAPWHRPADSSWPPTTWSSRSARRWTTPSSIGSSTWPMLPGVAP